MKTLKLTALLLGVLIAPFSQSFGQNNLQFTGVKATSEKAIQLYWASNTNEVYEVDCADAYTECKPGSITNIVRIRISGWDSCFNDSLQLYNDPDLNTIDYQDRTVFIPQ